MKYITPDGVEISLNSVRECVAAIRAGRLTATTMVFDEANSRWVPAGKHPDAAALLGLTPNSAPAAESTKSDQRVRAVVWLLTFLIPLGVAVATHVNVANALGTLLGCFIWALIIGGVVDLIRKLFKRPRVSPGMVPARAVLTIVFALIIVGDEGLRNMTDRRAAATSAKALTQSMESLNQTAMTKPQSSDSPSSSSPDGVVPPKPTSNTATASDTAMAAMLMDILKQSFDEMGRIRQDQMKAAEALRPETMLTPETLTSESKLHDSDARILAYEAALDVYEQRTKNWLPSIEEKVRALPISDANKDEFVRSARGSNTGQNISEFLQIERSMIKETRAIHAFAEDRLGRLTVSNNRLMFVTNADLEYYNSEMAKVSKLADRESAVMARSAKKSAEGQEKLKATIAQFANQ